MPEREPTRNLGAAQIPRTIEIKGGMFVVGVVKVEGGGTFDLWAGLMSHVVIRYWGLKSTVMLG